MSKTRYLPRTLQWMATVQVLPQQCDRIMKFLDKAYFDSVTFFVQFFSATVFAIYVCIDLIITVSYEVM